MLRTRAESVEQIAGGNVIKQGDEATLVFQFRDEMREVMDIQGSAVIVKIANSRAVVLEKTAEVNQNNTISLQLTKDDVIGWGDMRIEFKIILANGMIRKFPKDDWYKIQITQTLDDLSTEEITYTTLETFTAEVNAATEQAQTKATEAETQALYAKKQGDFAKQQGQAIVGEISTVNTHLEDTPSLLKAKYKLKCDGTDSVTSLQNVLNDLSAIGYENVIFPPSSVFYLNAPLTIPKGLKLDFSYALITVMNSISQSPIKLNGGNTKIKNVKVIQKDHNYSSPSGVCGIEYKGSENVNNLFFENVETQGFEIGINIFPKEGFVASNIKFLNCTTNYAELYGLNVSNVYDVTIDNHTAMFNCLDGLKTTKNATKIRINGGRFSKNVHPTATYADGIDLYAGANDVVMSKVVCEDNGGVGVHVLSGELNDINYQNPIYGVVKNIVMNECIANRNVSAGIDVLCKRTVSATAPYASKIVLNNCIATENGIGINLTARHVTINSCIISGNKTHGIQATDCIYLKINSPEIVKNSISSAGVYAGIYLKGCQYVNINGGTINGSDSDVLQKEDGSALTVYHLYGVWIDDIANSNHIYIETKEIVNFTSGRGVYITNFNTIENATKMIVIHLGDIGSKPLNNQIGQYGSSLYRNGSYYLKKTNLNDVTWVQQT